MKLSIIVTSKAQNAHLAKLVDEFGSQKAVANKLGVSVATFSKWLNFKTVLMPGGTGTGGLSHRRYRQIAKLLTKLTGQHISNIFPNLTKHQLSILATKQVVKKTVDIQSLDESVDPALLTDGEQERFADNALLADAINRVL